MLTRFNHFGDSAFYGEKRLVYKDPEKPKPPTEKELLDSTAGLLRQLQAQVATRPGTTPAPDRQTYHTERRDTRMLVEPPKNDPDAVKQTGEALALGGYLSKKEVENMQSTQNHLYEHYMNPAFMLYLQRRGGGLYEKVYTALDLVLKNPYEFEYVPATGNQQKLEIVKRRPYKSNGIPNDFKIVLETADGYITNVNGDNLKGAGSEDIPWMPNSEYNKKMKDYLEQWQIGQHNKRLGSRYKAWKANGSQPPEEGEKIRMDSFTSVPADLKTIHVLNNIKYPERFIALVQARNLGWEATDPRYVSFLEHQKQQGKDYEDITKNNKLFVMVVADQELEGVYQIWTSKNDEERTEPLRVTKEGFMLENLGGPASPRWVKDRRYTDALQNRYYKQNPDAKKKLSPEERKEQEDRETKEKERKEEEERKAQEAKDKLDKAKGRRTEVDTAMENADLPALRAAAKAIPIRESGDEARQKNIDAEKDPNKLRITIKKALDNDTDGSEINKAAEVLVDNPAKLQEAQKKRKGIDAALKKADLQTVTTVAKGITPTEYHGSIDKLVAAKNKAGLLQGIKTQMNDDVDGSVINKVAEILQVS